MTPFGILVSSSRVVLDIDEIGNLLFKGVWVDVETVRPTVLRISQVEEVVPLETEDGRLQTSDLLGLKGRGRVRRPSKRPPV